ncbi:NACHT domain-containing protein [Desulfosediminicola flagellatus]|uniref:NACHT domain-containing protein n=1 Tax=Desulfosediminicola flagellatus TaxID=2569541 RepID=UPI0010ABEE2C|nr:NACHT domain-containing protein [Desulfosediminicola flagellatus]
MQAFAVPYFLQFYVLASLSIPEYYEISQALRVNVFMNNAVVRIDDVRVSRSGHTFHERWAARRALQLVFPKDNLFAIVIEGLSPNEHLELGQEAEDIADLTLFYGNGDTFETCTSQQILQFKYKEAAKPVTSSYLKKTVKKFSATLRAFKTSVSDEEIGKKLSFGFVTNAELSGDLWEAIACLKLDRAPESKSAKKQLEYLKTWCKEEEIEAEAIFPLIEFRAATSDLPAQNRSLRRTVSDWSANSTGHAAKRLFALVELVREKAQIEGQGKNSIRREDILNALECDEDQLFPADTRFVNVGDVVERSVLQDIKDEIKASNLPVFLHADGGVGKTVFIQSLAAHLTDTFEVVVFDCFGGGSYRSEAQARHMPKIGLLQIINELATRGLCDPLLPTDSDQYGLIEIARKRLNQASKTVQYQSAMQGVLIVLDAADNAQLEADARNEVAFPRLLLASLSADPLNGVKLLLTARPHRMDGVIGKSQVKRLELEPFTEEETQQFLETRRKNIKDLELSTALIRSRGNARVLEYLVESWDTNVSGSAPQTKISVEELIAQKCEKIFRDLHTAGWSEMEIREFFAALSLLPPPIPLTELAKALGWSDSQVNSAASDLAPMLELVTHGAIFRDEPTETYIKDHYASEVSAQQSIAQRLQMSQKNSIYAAEALPHFLVVIGDSNRAYQLAGSDDFPTVLESEYGRRRLKLARLYAAFSLASRDKDLDRVLSLTMQLSQVASANARGDEFIRRSPAMATILGDSDASRRLFNDRSGWRGARDARLIVAYCFSNELDEALIHQSRAIGWINWYLHNDDKTKQVERSRPEVSDIAAVMFLSVLKNEFSVFNRNIKLWNIKFALSVIQELITLCAYHEASNGSEALLTLAEFAGSKRCHSLILQIGLLSNEYGLSKKQLKAVSRAASSLSQRYKKKVPDDNTGYEMELQGTIADAAMNSLVVNSRQSTKRLLKSYRCRRPSSYDYGVHHDMNWLWIPVQTAYIKAWSSGKELSFHDLMPEEVKIGRKTISIATEADLSLFLDSLFVTKYENWVRKGLKPEKYKQFSKQEQEIIVTGATCALQLGKPIEAALLSKVALSNDVFYDFLVVWESSLRPDVHWRAETGKDNVARHVGIGLASMLLRHSETVEENEAEKLVEIINTNRFSLAIKLSVLALIARRPNLADVAGAFANTISSDIVKDDYIEQRGKSYRELAGSLISMSVGEAQEYYAQGLAQLDQMGGDDFDLIYSALHYSAEQSGGFMKPELSHRLMNLCQTIFQHEPSKFGWTLFGRAAASSIGFPAIYKLIRWYDQGAVNFSYGLPQLACYLAKAGHLDARRSAVLLTICEDHGWHEWQVGKGIHDLLSVAEPKDRRAIFSVVTQKLEQEHSFGGWKGLSESLLGCMDAFEEINNEGFRAYLQGESEAAKRRRDIKNAECNHGWTNAEYSLQAHAKKHDEHTPNALADVIDKCDPTCATSLDVAIQAIDGLPFENRKRLFDELRKACPYDKRAKFLEALCESAELKFDRALDLIIECVKDWGNSSAHLRKSVSDLIKKLFAFKGSELFDLRYSDISQQINRMSNLCDDPIFVLQIVLETIAKERLELRGDEWLQLATSLSRHTLTSTALDAFENLLSSSAAKVGDEIGEGMYRNAFAGKNQERDAIADIIWHLLGDSDAFVRWSAARSLKYMLDVGLTEDVGRLLDYFDINENPSLASEEHYFAFMNAQQWLLMGLARAALHHGETLKPLKSQIAALAKRNDLHVLNKLHLARCLKHIEGGKSMSPELAQLWTEVQTPPHGIVERDGWPDNKDRRFEFGFDYDFVESEISSLAGLFWISENEACDRVADEVKRRWPDAKSMSDFPGRVRYQGDERFETYAEHIQRHTLLHAATTLVKTMPVERRSYYWGGLNPWQKFIQDGDVSFEDGSWLSDHKDPVPAQAREYLLGNRKGNQETLVKKELLFKKVGFPKGSKDRFLPLYGHWVSQDGVHVSLISALVMERGAVGQCTKLAKTPVYDLWLPRFKTDGMVDRYSKKRPFTPLIWEPEKYPVGIDERDEWAARGTIARPKLGLAINKLLGLASNDDGRHWHDNAGRLVLKSDVWGEWKPDFDVRGRSYQNEGAILWAEHDWLGRALRSCKRSLIFKLDFSKYRSNKSYDESSGVRELYVGLKRSGESPRFWYAKKASETVY